MFEICRRNFQESMAMTTSIQHIFTLSDRYDGDAFNSRIADVPFADQLFDDIPLITSNEEASL